MTATGGDSDGTKVRKLILVRHAQTEWNRQGRFQGQLDSPVTSEGVAQIEAVAKMLRTANIDAVYTSDLGRSILTADRIARAVGAPIVVDVRLRERSYGIFEGLTHAAAGYHYPEIVDQLRNSLNSDFSVPGGESKRALLNRVLEGLHDAVRGPGDGAIVAIGHGGSLRVFLNYVSGQPIMARNGYVVRNCSISEVEYADGRWYPKSVGNADHLPVLA